MATWAGLFAAVLLLCCGVHAQPDGPVKANQTWWFYVPPARDGGYGRACPEIGWAPHWSDEFR